MVALAGVLALAGCSGGSEPAAPTSSTSTTTSSSSAPATPASLVAKGAPTGLTPVLKRQYAAATAPVRGTVTTGTWKGQRVAVFVAGKDATLAVAPPSPSTDWRIVGGWWPSLKRGADLGGRTHVLLIGSDARPGQDPTRTRGDALQLLGVDGKGGGGILGFARDLYVPVAGHGTTRINAALSFGGPQLQTSTVSALSGIQIEGYVVTGFEGFEKIVDDLGQLPYTSDVVVKGDASHANVRKGYQRLNGREALALARERKTLPGGDFDRSANQGLILAAGMLEARQQGVGTLPQLMTVVSRHAESDLTAAQMLRIGAWAYRLEPAMVGHGVVKGTPVMRGGASVVELDSASRTLMTNFRDGRLP